MSERNSRSPLAQLLPGRGLGKKLEGRGLLGPIPVVCARLPLVLAVRLLACWV